MIYQKNKQIFQFILINRCLLYNLINDKFIYLTLLGCWSTEGVDWNQYKIKTFQHLQCSRRVCNLLHHFRWLFRWDLSLFQTLWVLQRISRYETRRDLLRIESLPFQWMVYLRMVNINHCVSKSNINIMYQIWLTYTGVSNIFGFDLSLPVFYSRKYLG